MERQKLDIFTEEEFQGLPILEGKKYKVLPSLPPSSWKNYKEGSLILCRHKGSFLRPCPATPQYNCCGLNIFHFGQGCSISCSYCILNAYLGSEAMVLFGNIDEGLSSLEEYLKQVAKDPDGDFPLADTSPRSHRFCTGEFTDSLLLDDVTHLAAKLVELFSKYPPALLELKTKTCQIQELIGLSHGQRTVVSFSVNSPEVVSKEEPRAATLTARLKAAEKLTRCGYQVGFHFDPLIHYKGWERGYQKTVETLFSIVDPQAIAWISLGCFRYLPNLKPLMLQKGAKSLFSEEFIKADDGKMRYPRPLRYLMYRTLMDFLGEKLSPSTILYLCMESGRLWNDLFGYDPGTPGLTKMFRPPFSPIAP